MSFFDNITARLPFKKANTQTEYVFAVNIGPGQVCASIWTVLGSKLQILNPQVTNYTSTDELVDVIDKLLAKTLGDKPVEPDKVLFGVPEGWLQDDDLKEPYLKLLRDIVKNLELKPLAYVSSSHAMSLFLEKEEGAPTTAILVGMESGFTSVTVVRAGKIDGTKVIKRGSSLGEEIEKALLSFTEVEVLPSRILLYGISGEELAKHKNVLLSFPWMQKLSFLHFPKIEVLDDYAEIQAVGLAGAIEVNGDMKYHLMVEAAAIGMSRSASQLQDSGEAKGISDSKKVEETSSEDMGFVTGDITKVGGTEAQMRSDEIGTSEDRKTSESEESEEVGGKEEEVDEDLGEEETAAPPVDDDEMEATIPEEKMPVRREANLQVPEHGVEEYEFDKPAPVTRGGGGVGFPRVLRPGLFKLLIPIVILGLLLAGLIFLPHATISVFVEPRVLEKDTQVVADPAVKSVDQENKKIPGQIVQTSISGSGSAKATGNKEVGNAAKGAVLIRNKTDEPKTFSQGTTLSGPNGLKFTLDSPVTVASRSGEDGTWGKGTGDVTAQTVGPDGNIPSESDLSLVGFSSDQFVAKSVGNFSGGTSKKVTVVTDDDQKKLLAQVASELRKQAKDSLQQKTPDKKILEEALTEEISKKSYNKNVGDQASEFSLNMTVTYKGTAYSDSDLKEIVAKLVQTNVPEGFELSLAESETQSDVSKVDKDGKVTFLARFRAKLIPKIDASQIGKQIRGKTPAEAAEILKGYENVLGSEIKLRPPLPAPIARLPFFEKNIKVEVSLK